MNKVYFFHDDEYMGVYIAAKSHKEAKNIALGTGVTDMMDNPFIDIRGHMVKRNSKTVKTEYGGELNICQLSELDLLWWGCSNEDTKAHEIIVNKELEAQSQYMCLTCGYIGNIPID